MSILIVVIIVAAEESRIKFVDKNYRGKMKMSLTIPKRVQVNRFSIYDDVIEVYSTDPNIVQQFPLSVQFQGEAGLGVGCDFFSAFWEQAYKRMFDGAALLTPVSHA